MQPKSLNDDVPSDEDIAAFRAILKAEDQRRDAPYDGLFGILPEWVPESIKRHFERTRNNLLNWRHNGEPTPTPVELVQWIDEQVTLSQLESGTYSRLGCVPVELISQVAELAAIKLSVSLGKNAGLANLTDPRIAKNAVHGEEMSRGRRVGALSPVAKKVKAYLAKNADAKTVEVWDALKKSPPKGYLFIESTRLGKYIEQGTKTVMEWRRFANIVSEQRPKKG